MKRSNLLFLVLFIIGAIMVVAVATNDKAVAQLPPGGGGPCETLINEAIEEGDVDNVWEASCEQRVIEGSGTYLCGIVFGWNYEMQQAVEGMECVRTGPEPK